ncbi:hypothetical protein CE557_146 [Cardinium endosymbiont of Sogatella furcifera]|uniref:hypothetical protein n=1 Tax=Cardinium endosymbiont of Sogatella furcifera TaxID=650378 RepID=UPI000E0D58B9|nr:hypothetical protein [Cardinium endosymbiont of Sogatella furcifera]AXI23984.1 hypothetical protein CE557_146 [Cardinium endosymbiont of Sogatella furcifera]
MRLLPYLLSMVVCIATNFKSDHAIGSQDVVDQTSPSTTLDAESDTTQDTPSDSLDEILKKDTHAEGVIQNILGGLALCYNVLANLLLYPIFSFLLLILSLGGLILLGLWVKKIKDEKSISTTWMLFTCLYLLFYFDLFLVVYQKRAVLFLFLELEKDLFLTIIAASIGYIIGKFFSSKFLEEKKLP